MSIRIPKEIELIILKRERIRTIILKYEKRKIWLNTSSMEELEEERRIIVGKRILINQIRKGIENLKLGYKKGIELKIGRPIIKEGIIIIGTRNYRIPKDMSVRVSGNKIKCWGRNETDIHVFLQNIKKSD